MQPIKINFIKTSRFSVTPTKASSGDAAYDLYSVSSTYLYPMERKVISTGLIMEIPEGYYGRIAPRSGLAIKHGIDVLAGVIDSSYRGDVGVILINLDPVTPDTEFEKVFGPQERYGISTGDRIAQLIIEKCHDVEWNECQKLGTTNRGEGGFGSTG